MKTRHIDLYKSALATGTRRGFIIGFVCGTVVALVVWSLMT